MFPRGRKIKHQTIQNLFNKGRNSTPQFELISDEEKLNIDRVVGQEERTFFCYRVGTVAGVFHLKVPEFKDIPENQINWTVVEQMYGNNDGSKGLQVVSDMAPPEPSNRNIWEEKIAELRRYDPRHAGNLPILLILWKSIAGKYQN